MPENYVENYLIGIISFVDAPSTLFALLAKLVDGFVCTFLLTFEQLKLVSSNEKLIRQNAFQLPTRT